MMKTELEKDRIKCVCGTSANPAVLHIEGLD